MTVLTRCLVALTNGFGGGFLGGLVYYVCASAFAGAGASFPTARVLWISLLLTIVDAARLAWQSSPVAAAKPRHSFLEASCLSPDRSATSAASL